MAYRIVQGLSELMRAEAHITPPSTLPEKLNSPRTHNIRTNQPKRRTAFALAAYSLLTNVLFLVLFHVLPNDPLHLLLHLRIYSYFATGMSVIGVWGIYTRSPHLVFPFSNYLLLDAVLSTLPRLLLLYPLLTYRSSFCLTTTPPSPSHSSAPPLSTGGSSLSSATVHPANPWPRPSSSQVHDLESFIEQGWTWSFEQRCTLAALVVQCAAALVIFGSVVAQWKMALWVRRFALSLTECGSYEEDGPMEERRWTKRGMKGWMVNRFSNIERDWRAREEEGGWVGDMVEPGRGIDMEKGRLRSSEIVEVEERREWKN